MKSFITIILIISLAGNMAGVYLLYKAIKLRDEVRQLQRYYQDLRDKYESLKADYPGTAVFAEENRKLLRETTAEERKRMTILFGASITKGWDLNKYFPGKKLLNRGVGSQSDVQLLTRFSSDILQLEPGQVVIKFCSGNFIPQANIGTMWDEFEIMVRMSLVRGIKPIVATVIPVTRRAEKFDNYSITSQIKIFNDKVKKLASELKLNVADYYSAMADGEGFLPDTMARDEIHPNEEGYNRMAEVLRPMID
jgi:lysophospholipase L1-like esterase